MLPLLLIGNDGTLGRPIRLNLVSRKWAAVVAGVVLAGIVLFAAIRLVHPMVGPSIAAVSAARLEESGTVLLNPFPWDRPEITQSQAERLALQQAPGGTVLQSVLAEVVETNGGTKQPRLCWVVSLPASLVSSYGPPGSAPFRATFNLVFIDAHSGDFVFGSAGG